jgi:hypothetical protein
MAVFTSWSRSCEMLKLEAIKMAKGDRSRRMRIAVFRSHYTIDNSSTSTMISYCLVQPYCRSLSHIGTHCHVKAQSDKFAMSQRLQIDSSSKSIHPRRSPLCLKPATLSTASQDAPHIPLPFPIQDPYAHQDTTPPTSRISVRPFPPTSADRCGPVSIESGSA